MVYYIYKITNKINNKYYFGKRQTKKENPNEDTNYLGSGDLIKLAIQKYGKENFSKEIIEVCNSFEELNERERFYIDETIIKDENSYNIALGGFGGNLGEVALEKLRLVMQSFEYRDKMSKIVNTPEIKNKMIASIKKTMGEKEWKEKFSEIQKKVQNTEENRKRNSKNQKIAQTRTDVVEKKKNTMLEMFSNEDFKNKHKSACSSESFKQKQRELKIGNKHIHNKKTLEAKRVKKEEVEKFLSEGWDLGMLPKELKLFGL